jgi:HK97 family phage major capsid protein
MSTEVINALKKFGETQGQQWEEFKKSNDARLEKIEKGEHVEALLKEKTDKIDSDLAEQSEKMDKLRRKLDAQRWYTKEGHDAGMTEAEMEYKSAFWEAVKYRGKKDANIPDEIREKGMDNMPEYLKAYDGDATDGLEWAPNDFIMELWRDIVEESPVAGLVRRYPTSRKSIEVPTHTGAGAAIWVGQGAGEVRAATVEATSGLVTIPTWEASTRYQAHRESLDDVVLGLEGIIRQDAAEQLGKLVGNGIVVGAGSTQPQGFQNKSGANTSPFLGTSAIKPDEIIDLYYDLKTSYAQSATWIAARATIGHIRGLRDDSSGTGTGQYMWTPGFGVAPDLILGRPVVEAVDMPAMGTGVKSVFFGDLRRAYAMADRHGVRTLVDPYSGAATALVDFYTYLRLGGDVIKTEAYSLGVHG